MSVALVTLGDLASKIVANAESELEGGIASVIDSGLWAEKKAASQRSGGRQSGYRLSKAKTDSPRGCKFCVEGTLGKSNFDAGLALITEP